MVGARKNYRFSNTMQAKRNNTSVEPEYEG